MIDEKRIALDLHIIEARLDDIWEKVKKNESIEEIHFEIRTMAWDVKLLFEDLGGKSDGLF